MNVAHEDVPAEIDSRGAVARHQPNFAGVSDAGNVAAGNFTLSEGTDVEARFEGLDTDFCQSTHWRYVVSGALTITYADSSERVDEDVDVFHWPPGDTARAGGGGI